MRWELADGAELTLLPDFVPADERLRLFAALIRVIPFEQKPIRIMGRQVMQPRLTAWIGDPEAVYVYSGTTNQPLPWPEPLLALREQISAAAGRGFNSVLCNLYRDGRDSMGFHSDSERELGPSPVIASLSLGAVRRFQLRHRRRREAGLELDLPDGSLLIMAGTLQHHYRHGVPKQPQISEPRLNLTFRSITHGGSART